MSYQVHDKINMTIVRSTLSTLMFVSEVLNHGGPQTKHSKFNVFL